jgi:serine/threonine protein kinase
MATDLGRVKDIFLAAAAQADPARREALLQEACGGDAELRRQVEALLRKHEAAGSFLEPPAADPAATADAPPGEAVGARLGPYKLLQKLGEGGMGTVWLAEQTEPVRRRVALKLIKPGMDSAKVIARFEQERQALAVMDHPNIARVLDAGTTVGGRPYFVMELVKGLPITKYCDQEHLTPQQRLELFIPVCQAVQHAHQKGVIHRDLKPSNVLIALYDGKPVPKVIDFGVAKATAQRLAEKTVFTEVGSLVGTLEYMAPEQAELNNLDIDTRADVYALGVLLYELLAGSPPFTGKQLRAAAFTEMLRIIREVEPQKPSTRLSSSEELPAIAAKRKLEPKRLAKVVRGDLDWVVMKCLEKERARRYETADALARDLAHYLADEPVAAGPPSVAYRLRKFVRRNRGPVLAAALVLVALVAGIAMSTWQAVRAGQAEELAQFNEGKAIEERDAKDAALKAALANEQRAQAAKVDAEKAAAAERQANALAQKRLGQIEKANTLLGSIFHDFNPSDEEKGGPTLKEQLVARLDQAAGQLDAEAVGDPVTVARLQNTLGETYLALGDAPKALALFAKAHPTLHAQLGDDHPDTLDSMNNLALAYLDSGKRDVAVTLLEEALRLKKIRLGDDHPDTLTSMSNLAACYERVGKLALAVPLLQQALERQTAKLGRDHPDTLNSMNNLAACYEGVGKHALAVPLYKEAIELMRKKFGPGHYRTVVCMNNLAAAYKAAGEFGLALSLYEEAYRLLKLKVGPDHHATLTTMSNLANNYRDAGQTDKALGLYQEALKRQQAKLGPDHPNTLITMNGLAKCYMGRQA